MFEIQFQTESGSADVNSGAWTYFIDTTKTYKREAIATHGLCSTLQLTIQTDRQLLAIAHKYLQRDHYFYHPFYHSVMHLILTGATGLAGSAVLAHILSLPAGQVTRLSILSRKPVLMAEAANKPNIKYIHHNDFSSYPPDLLQELKGADGVVWALGISQTEANKEDYIKITKDYTLEAAKAFSGLSDNFKFIYVSGEVLR